MKKINTTTIQTPTINVNYSANGVELKIQGCKIDCPTSDVAEVTKSFYDGVNRSMEESFSRMGIDITKVGSIFNQLLNFGDENISKLLKVASKGVNELIEEAEGELKEVETAEGFYNKHLFSKPHFILLFDRHLDSRLTPINKRWFGITFEYASEAEHFLEEMAKGFGELVVTTPVDESELPIIKSGVIRVNPKTKSHFRTILWKLEAVEPSTKWADRID